ncbi:MAG: CYTH domain-containing protein [Bacteroidales bacterium]|nr:CYTH domain-containing protein [Bacteroidales bacterium]MCM1146861.1 CYTH domain-containing protein [Bacteroidales bacterium]MCM1205641.1 CYTH domain-containing protein [Bacillota bacterium]MCM1510247.1 CYTH domain-containing protein [Clostridium sp.]
MSGKEIERKFLVRKAGSPWRGQAFSACHIQQAYMAVDGATVRVRIRDAEAFLTIKGPSRDGGLSRYEFEKEITIDEAEQLLELCRGGTIDKTRYLVRSGSHTFEVDEFHGANEGLVFAEVELGSADEAFDSPSFIGPEVTGNRHYYNTSLLAGPYSQWKHEVPEEYR